MLERVDPVLDLGLVAGDVEAVTGGLGLCAPDVGGLVLKSASVSGSVTWSSPSLGKER